MCIRIAAQSFANIDMPMGGKITSVDADHIELVIPRIQLFDVWLQPRALAALRWGCLGHWVTWGLITRVGTLGYLGSVSLDGKPNVIREVSPPFRGGAAAGLTLVAIAIAPLPL